MTSSPTDVAAPARWMQLHLGVLMGQPSETIDVDAPLSVFDLDSLDAVTMALELEKAMGVEISPETFLQGDQTIARIADGLRAS